MDRSGASIKGAELGRERVCRQAGFTPVASKARDRAPRRRPAKNNGHKAVRSLQNSILAILAQLKAKSLLPRRAANRAAGLKSNGAINYARSFAAARPLKLFPLLQLQVDCLRTLAFLIRFDLVGDALTLR